MIAIIDYGMGNLRSVAKAFEKVGAEACITEDPEDLKKASGIVLPGVGAFKPAMEGLESLGIIPTLLDEIEKGKPFLGICLGLQLLMSKSEEDGSHEGLGVIPGKCVRFRNDLKVPHMGWNQLKYYQKDNPMFSGIDEYSYFYFVHSYYVAPDDKDVIAATTDYGGEVAVALSRDNIFATQFHPEKSQTLGIKMLENFNYIVKNGASK